MFCSQTLWNITFSNCYFFVRKRQILTFHTKKIQIVTFSLKYYELFLFHTKKIRIITSSYNKITNCYFFYRKDTNRYFFDKKYENATNPSGPNFFFKYNTYCILLKSMLSPVGHNFQPKEVMIANLYNLFICWPSKNRSDWWGSDPGFESCIFCTTV